MKPGEYWTHENLTDVFIKIVDEESDGYVIQWWNRSATNNPFPIGFEWYPKEYFNEGWMEYFL